MATIAIQIGIAVGVAAVNYLLTPKPKLEAVDKGKLDDLRVTTAEEGAFIPRCYGRRVRLGGNIIWATPTQEHITTTPGRTGGKGGGGAGSAPPERHFSYTKSFDILISDTPSRALKRIWDGTEVIFDQAASEGPGYYEANEGTLAGGAVVEDNDDATGELWVRLPVGASVTFAVDALFRSPGPLVLYYAAPSGGTVTIDTGGTVPTITPTLPASATLTTLTPPFVDLPEGTTQLTVTNSGASTIYLDRIFYFAGFPDDPPDEWPRVTGALTHGAYPSDLGNPAARYDARAFADGQGVTEALTTAGVWRFYAGTGAQDADSLEVAQLGADNTPAYRGVTRIVFEEYTLRENGRFDNFTFEIAPLITDLADIVADLFAAAGLDIALLDATALRGIKSAGWVVNQPDLDQQIDGLSQWYNFDLVPVGGKIVAVLRQPATPAPVTVITQDQLGARYETDTPSAGPVEITHPERDDLPGEIEVNYLDPGDKKDYHTGVETFALDAAGSRDRKKVTFPVVSTPDEAQGVARRLLLTAVHEREYTFATGPQFAHLAPTDRVELRREGATDALRLVGQQADLGGLTKWRAVRERAALYTQLGPGQTGSGTEIPPVVQFPANSILALLDVGPLRDADDTLGYYAAVAPRGAGEWRGARLYQTEADGTLSDLTIFDRPAMIGFVVTPLGDWDGPGWDRTSALVVDFFHDTGEISSRPESDLLNGPVNVLAVNTGDGVEVMQYATATASAGTFPYVVRYTFANFLRGRLNTEAVTGGHVAGQLVVSLSDAVKFRGEELRNIGSTRQFRAATIGQAIQDAPVMSFHFAGWNTRPPAPVLDSVASNTGNIHLAWTRRSRYPSFISGADVPPGADVYELDVLTAGGTLKQTLTVRAGQVDEWLPLYYENDDGGGGVVIGGYDCGQRLDVTDTVLEAEFLDTDTTPYTPELQLHNVGPSGRQRLRAGLSPSVGLYVYEVSEAGVSSLVYQQNETPDVTARVRLGIRDGRVSVWYNYTYTEQPANYRSPLTVTAGASPTARVSYGSSDGATTLGRTTIRTVRADTVLRHSDLLRWFGGSVPSPFLVRIYEMSPVVGRGRVLEVEVT